MKFMRIIGALCLLYYVAIISYAGFSVAFSKFWLAAGVILLAGSFMIKRILVSCPLRTWPPFLKYGLSAGLVAAAAAVIILLGCIGIGMLQKEQPGLDYIVVLGAQVKGDRPSAALMRRMEAAGRYLEENENTTAILSGGQGPGEDVSEAQAMRDWLVRYGISEDRLKMEEQSVNTMENLKFSAAFLDTEEDRIGIISNNFHVFRAVQIAKKQGYAEVSGIPAASVRLLQPHMIVRESFAILKDWLTGNM